MLRCLTSLTCLTMLLSCSSAHATHASSLRFASEGATSGSKPAPVGSPSSGTSPAQQTTNAPAPPAPPAPPPPVPTALQLTNSLYYGAGNCNDVSINVQSSTGAPLFLKSAEVVTLATSSSTGNFYSDSSCTQTTKQVTLRASTQSAAAYYLDMTPGTVSVTVSDASGGLGLKGSSGTFTLTATSQLAFVGSPLSQNAGDCGGLQVETDNVTGSAVTQTSPVNLTVATSSETGTFYSDSKCTSVTTAVTVASGTTMTPMFFYSDNTDGSPQLSAQESPSENWLSATTTATINDPNQQSNCCCCN